MRGAIVHGSSLRLPAEFQPFLGQQEESLGEQIKSLNTNPGEPFPLSDDASGEESARVASSVIGFDKSLVTGGEHI